MNQQEFLENLKKALEENQIDSKDILELYKGRFDIGYEAGMNDEEIISAFDTIEQIILKYKDHESLKTMNLDIDLLFFSDFVICNSNSKGLHLTVDEGVKEYITITQNDSELKIKPHSNLGRNKKYKKYDGRLEIGSDVVFDSINISNLSCDIKCGNLTSNQMTISNVSGDINLNEVKVQENIIVTNTSGDISFKKLTVPNAKISTISGDIKFAEVVLDKMDLETVSGNITIDYCNEEAQYTVSSVSGNVYVKHGAYFENVKASSLTGYIEINGETKKVGIIDNIEESLKNFKKWKK